MPYPVRYRCPRCGTVVTLQREGYLADKSVTPYPLEGWTYAEADAVDDGADGVSASGGSSNRRFDGVRIVCGEGESDSGEPNGVRRTSSDGTSVGGERHDVTRPSSDERNESDGEGCGEPFYLSFVRFEDGREVEPEPESQRVELAPDRPRWPGGPGR